MSQRMITQPLQTKSGLDKRYYLQDIYPGIDESMSLGNLSYTAR